MRRDEEITAIKETTVTKAVRDGWEFTLDAVNDRLEGEIHLIKRANPKRGNGIIRGTVYRKVDEDGRVYFFGGVGWVNDRFPMNPVEADTLGQALALAEAILTDLVEGRKPARQPIGVYA